MSVKVFEVAQPGMLTTVQDLGRLGYQRLGVPMAGAMDPFALRVGNMLLGNSEAEAALEATFMGPAINVLADAVIAVTGGDLGASLNGKRMPTWQTVAVSKGDAITFQGPQKGIRAYVCVAGGIEVPVVMGSRSTYLRSKMGGYQGRPLREGDVLEAGQPRGSVPMGKRLSNDLVPSYGGDVTLRVVLGPQDDEFSDQGIQTFLSSEYEVTPQMDRMGIRLQGPEIEHREKADIISDGIVFGSVQIPGNGQPIVMMADRQTTGGYTKIATIVFIDVPKMAQAQPGDKIRFKEVSVEEAQALYRELEERLESAIEEPRPATVPVPALSMPIQERPPVSVEEEVPEGAIVATHQGKRYVITAKDDVYSVSPRRRGGPQRYRIIVAGASYQVEV